MSKSRSGFTIVELLIVIVVIGILAAITIVAYNSVQQRARNTTITDAASKSLRLIQAYVAEQGSYPIVAGEMCITTASGCASSTVVSASTTFDTNMKKIGDLPRNVPNTGDTHYGIYLTYAANTTYNGDAQPLRMNYFLNGTNQQCGLSRVSAYAYPGYTSSVTGYTVGDVASTGKTLCWISVPGPAA